MKKIYFLIVTIILLVTHNNIMFADDRIEENNIEEIGKVIETASEISEKPKTNSRYAIVLDREIKAILYGKN